MWKTIIFVCIFWIFQTYLIFSYSLTLEELLKYDMEKLDHNLDMYDESVKDFYITSNLIGEAIYKGKYNEILSLTDLYIKQYKYIFEDIDYNRDYMQYGYIANILLIKALTLFEDDRITSCELMYLNFYILNKYKFPRITRNFVFYNSFIETPARDFFYGAFYENEVKFLLYKFIGAGVNELFKYEMYDEYILYYNFNTKVLVEALKNIEENYIFDEVPVYTLLSGMIYEKEKTKGVLKSSFDRLKAFKGIERALLLYIVDEESGKQFHKKLRRKAKLNIKTASNIEYDAYYSGSKNVDHYKYTLFLTMNDRLGKKLLRKHVLNLK